MSTRAPAWLAWFLWALSLPLIATASVLGVASPSMRIWPDSIMLVLLPLLSLMFLTVGAVVASRRPENPIGWIFCIEGLLSSVVVLASTYGSYALQTSPDPHAGAEYATWFAWWIAFPTLFLAATLLFLLFPDGRFLSPEWSFAAVVAALGCVMACLGEAFGRETISIDYGGNIPNPVAVGGVAGSFFLSLGGFGTILLVLSCLASVASSLARWVWARGQERQQLKWFAYAAVTMIGGFTLAFTFGSSSDLMWNLGWVIGILGFVFLPLATAIAILKHRLYDIDRIINRTLVYGSLTALLALVYFGGVTATQAIVQTFTSRQELPQFTIVASTLVIAALFNPLRRRIQAFIDRRFYRRKYDTRKTLETFSARLREDTDLESLNGELVEVVRETMQPEHVSVWLSSDPSPHR